MFITVVCVAFIARNNVFLSQHYLANMEKEKELCIMRLGSLYSACYNFAVENSSDWETWPENFEALDTYYPTKAPRNCPCGGSYSIDQVRKIISCPNAEAFGHVWIR